jgi:non-heme Fe2+,alpha-ketoglutarate-dependent halogenase
MARLDANAVQAFRTRGFYAPVRALSPAEAARFRTRMDETEARYGRFDGPMIQKPHLLFPWIDELIRHPGILDPVEDLLGPDLLVWTATFFIKEPHDTRFVPWHQDLQAWALDPPDIVSVWIALSDSTLENGAMRVIPGTQTQDLPHHETKLPGSMLRRNKEIQVEVDADKAVALILKPGEMSLHQARLVHGSDPNPSSQRRIGLAVRYISPKVRQTSGMADTATLVRGKDSGGHFELTPRPTTDMAPDMIEYHTQQLAAHKKIVER